MRNWIIILLIFALPIGMYAFLDVKAQNDMMCKLIGNDEVKIPKAKIIKFTSPMCSECKEAQQELDKAMKNYKSSVIVEEINVIQDVGRGTKYNKAAIKKFKVTLVPTLVFLNKEGQVIKRYEGAMKAAEIIEVLDGVDKNVSTIH